MKTLLRAYCFLLVLFTTKGLSAATISIDSATSILRAGQSVTLDIYGTTSVQMGGFSLYLDSSEPAGDFQITGSSLNTADFSYAVGSPSLPETISATQSSLDLGGFADSDLAANTQYLLTTVTVSLGANIAPGHYWIGNTASTVFTDSSFTQADYASASQFGFTVVAAPEPEAYAFMFLGLIALAGFFIHKRNLNRKFRYLGDSRR